MSVRKSGLGKGLDSLIPAGNKTGAAGATGDLTKSTPEASEKTVKIEKIEPNREQPRQKFDEESLAQLADSIKRYGVIQPIVVREKGDFYEIIAGERRWRAARQAGLKEIPVIVKPYTESQSVEIALIENIQRENLNPIEEAQAYERLLDEFKLTQDEVAERVSKSRVAVTNSLRLMKLTDKVKQMLIDGQITAGHARALLALEDSREQEALAERVCVEKLSVRETEKIIRDLKKPKAEKQPILAGDAIFYNELKNKMETAVGTKVNIVRRGEGKGKVEISYYSINELERIYDLLTSAENR